MACTQHLQPFQGNLNGVAGAWFRNPARIGIIGMPGVLECGLWCSLMFEVGLPLITREKVACLEILVSSVYSKQP